MDNRRKDVWNKSTCKLDVKKSMDLLGDALTTPTSIEKSFHPTTQATSAAYKHSLFVPTSKASASNFGLLNTTGLFTSFDAPSNKALYGSTMLNSTQKTGFLSQSNLEDVSMTNVTLLLGDDAGLSACRNVFIEFAASVKTEQHELFDPVIKYHEICLENMKPLLKIVKGSIPAQTRMSRTMEVLMLLEHELDTWGLILSIFQDRYSFHRHLDEQPMMTVDSYNPSEKKLTNMLFDENQSLRQAQIVVDWLEHIAERRRENFYNHVEFSIDKMGAWENTLHLLKEQRAGNQLFQTGKLNSIVNRLDPDAPTRQNKHLVDLDEDDDQLLLQYIFCCIRAGKMDEACRVCTKVGQLWRAATLEGWKLYHDPNMEGLGSGGRIQMAEGNKFRDLWKRTCWKLTEDEKLSVYERGIYAALSGNLRLILPCCTSWHDYVWAYFRVMVEQIVETNIRKSFVGPRPLVELPNSYWEKSFTFESIFTEIEASTNEKIQNEAMNRFMVIQKNLILGEIEYLIELMHDWCKSEIQLQPHMMRFMAHLVLFLQSFEINMKDELCYGILVEYIKLLIKEKQVDIIAMYVAKLPATLQSELYARFLEDITGTDERRHCLQLAKEAGLDVTLIAKQVVENIRSRGLFEITMDTDLQLEGVTTQDDQMKIDAIEWLIFDPEHRAEALRQANAIMRIFLGTHKLSACKATACFIPIDSLDLIVKMWQRKTGNADLSPEDDNVIREFLCIKAYIDAQDGFLNWFEHFHRAKPVKPEIGVGGNFTERVALEHKQREYEMELERWQLSLMQQTQATVKKIYNVLHFVDGGWMIDQQIKENSDDENRLHQMLLLRQVCLPRMCFLLHKVLHTTEQFKECLQIADIIASDEYHLYRLFKEDQLQLLLQGLRDSSVALLNIGLDTLGYPLS